MWIRDKIERECPRCKLSNASWRLNLQSLRGLITLKAIELIVRYKPKIGFSDSFVFKQFFGCAMSNNMTSGHDVVPN